MTLAQNIKQAFRITFKLLKKGDERSESRITYSLDEMLTSYSKT